MVASDLMWALADGHIKVTLVGSSPAAPSMQDDNEPAQSGRGADRTGWRHAHASHALDRGATLAEVQWTLGHANVATTSGYLHARPNGSSGLKLDEGIFR